MPHAVRFLLLIQSKLFVASYCLVLKLLQRVLYLLIQVRTQLDFYVKIWGLEKKLIVGKKFGSVKKYLGGELCEILKYSFLHCILNSNLSAKLH